VRYHYINGNTKCTTPEVDVTRILILMFIIIACAQTSSSQSNPPVAPVVDSIEFNDVIIVTSGGRIVGEIVELEVDEKVTILREDGERFDIPWKKVARITIVGEEGETQGLILHSLDQPGYALRTRPRGTLRIIFNTGTESSGSGLHAIGGKTFRENFFVGLGTGWEMLSDVDGGFLPLFVEATWYPIEGPAAPFVSIEAGHMIGWIEGDHYSDYDGNWIGFGYGILGSFWDGTGLVFRMQMRRSNMSSHPLFSDKKNQLGFSLGVVF
jgi:hypothetical protein